MLGIWKKCQPRVKSYYISKLTNEDGDMAERLDEMEDSVLLVAHVLKELFTHLYMRLSPLAEGSCLACVIEILLDVFVFPKVKSCRL